MQWQSLAESAAKDKDEWAATPPRRGELQRAQRDPR
jgi:hypothetical protein